MKTISSAKVWFAATFKNRLQANLIGFATHNVYFFLFCFLLLGESESTNDDETKTTDLFVSHLLQVSIVPHDFDISGSLVGVKSTSWVDLYDLYKQHSRAVGFSVRKSTTRRRGGPNGIVTEKYFLCSCEGEPKSKKSRKVRENDGSSESRKKNKKRVASTRTSCEAFLRLKLRFKRRENYRGEHESLGKGNGLVPDVYEVVSHVVAHNHTLTPRRWQHHHRSERRISQEEGALIEVMTEERVPAVVQYRFLSTSCGGDENVGHTQKDHFNFVNRLKMKAIEGGDAQIVIEMLQKRQAEDPGFFFRDWEDYLLYHDVIIFYTTYRTNKYNLICGAFVGINNHWSNIMFGCVFLFDEKTESFEWLFIFETFNESMGGDVFPISIFTDQDQAMSNAIEKVTFHSQVYPVSRHKLCLWHIQQNALSHFGSLKKDPTFQRAFNKCLRGCFNETEFELAWNKMITEYEKIFFPTGILSSQRSESTNHAIDFYAIFNETHASEVYTHTLFREFEKEFGIAISTLAVSGRQEGAIFVYRVFLETCSNDAHIVTFDANNVTIDYTCRNYQEAGLLCFYSIRVLHLHSVSKIPKKYICTWWTKYAKYEV
ncbi:hypothetical protein RND81_04G080600 [Saponaria officinalis]|uniref:Protein FAR1-RELATED SEQUENCE n=1 Tax=Saponaria officinalis TaxID=3572 RepID=A0AAW1LHG2_SAPOF